jgi:hypothetical protein
MNRCLSVVHVTAGAITEKQKHLGRWNSDVAWRGLKAQPGNWVAKIRDAAPMVP